MTDYFVEFCENIWDITKEEIKWIESIPKVSSFGGVDYLEKFQAALEKHDIETKDVDLEFFPKFEWHVDERDRVWSIYSLSMYADDSGVDHVAITVQAFIRKFRPHMVFKLTWSQSCNDTVPGVFGGGYLVVSKDEIKRGDVWKTAYGEARIMSKKDPKKFWGRR